MKRARRTSVTVPMIMMTTFFAKPGVQKTLRYTAAYVMYMVMSLLGLAVTWNIRGNVLTIAAMFSANAQVTYILYTWGTYLLFIPFVIFAALLEPYLNKAARENQVWPRVRKVLLIEVGLGLVSLLITLFAHLTGQLPGWLIN